MALVAQAAISEIGREQFESVWADTRPAGNLAENHVIAGKSRDTKRGTTLCGAKIREWEVDDDTSPFIDRPTPRPPRAGPNLCGAQSRS